MLGKEIRRLRCNLGFNECNLAKKLNVVQSNIPDYESGKKIQHYLHLKRCQMF